MEEVKGVSLQQKKKKQTATALQRFVPSKFLSVAISCKKMFHKKNVAVAGVFFVFFFLKKFCDPRKNNALQTNIVTVHSQTHISQTHTALLSEPCLERCNNATAYRKITRNSRKSNHNHNHNNLLPQNRKNVQMMQKKFLSTKIKYMFRFVFFRFVWSLTPAHGLRPPAQIHF